MTTALVVALLSVWVPQEYGSIQEAVDAVPPGSRINVAPGEWCGATIGKRVHVVGWGHPNIVGCAAPSMPNGLRVGFLIEGPAADGTSVRGLRFDGRGIASDNLEPLGMAVYGNDVDGVSVMGNHIAGTAQAITNNGGSTWIVADNWIKGFTGLGCDPGLCGGGVAIAMQQRDRTKPRATGNVVASNRIEGVLPEGLHQFSLVGVFVVGQEGSSVTGNHFVFQDAGRPATVSVGIETLASKGLLLADNQGRGADYVLVLYRDASGDAGHAEGAEIFWNRGLHDVGDDVFWQP